MTLSNPIFHRTFRYQIYKFSMIPQNIYFNYQLTTFVGSPPSPFLGYKWTFGGHLLTFFGQLWMEGSQMLHQLSHIGVDNVTAILAREIAPWVETQVFAHVGFIEELLSADMTSCWQFTWIHTKYNLVLHQDFSKTTYHTVPSYKWNVSGSFYAWHATGWRI